MCYMWLQGDNIMAMAVHVRTILGCRNFHRHNLADQDGAGRLVSELAAQVYIYTPRDTCIVHGCIRDTLRGLDYQLDP